MKKYLLSFAVVLSATLFTACNDKDNGGGTYTIPVTNGAFVICSGNAWSGIDGDLTYLDYATGTSLNDQFYAKNGRKLGGTPNDIMVYGDKMYIAVTDENTLEIVNAKTLASLAQLKLTSLMGVDKGIAPRHLAGADGIVYVTTYGGCTNTFDPDTWATTTEGNGYVAAIDTLNFSLKNVYTAGSYPEGITISGDLLFVANSDYGAQTKASITVINVRTQESTNITDSKITNPTDVAVAGTDLYILDQGNYADVKGGIRLADLAIGDVKTLFDCTNATFVGYNIYAADCSEYGASVDHFIVYNIQSGVKKNFPSGVNKFFYPNVVTADPLTEHIFVASYSEKADVPNTPDYSANGYVVEYDQYGSPIREYTCGVGPNAIDFYVSYEEVKY